MQFDDYQRLENRKPPSSSQTTTVLAALTVQALIQRANLVKSEVLMQHCG